MSLDKILEEIAARIYGKRGKSTEEWIKAQDPWTLSPINVRDETLLECANLVKRYRDSKVKANQDSLPSMQSQLSENLVDSQSDSATNSKEERR